MRTGVIIAVLGAVVLAALAAPAPAQEKADKNETKTVTVTGMAAGADVNAHDEALMDALHKAVEQGVGTFVQSKTEVKNYAVIYEKIVSQTRGYISSYKEIDKGVENGEDPKRARTWVKIEAVVSLGYLKSDWQQLAFLLEQKGNPKIMVMVRDKIDGTEQKGEVDRATASIESFLQDKGIRPVDKSTMEANKLSDMKAASLEGNLAKVAALGKEQGAQLAIIGYVDSTFQESVEPYKGVGVWHSYRASLVIKAVQTENASVIWSKTFAGDRKTDGKDKSKQEAAYKALTSAVSAAAPEVLQGLMKAWNEDILQGMDVTVTIQGVSYRELSTMMKKLQGIRFVTNVTRDHFSNNIAKLRVKSRYDGFKLADELVERKICGDWQITDAQTNTVGLDLSLKEEDK
jgi:hypothetical protein